MSVILMAMTLGGLIAAFVLLIISLWTKRDWLRNFVLGAVALWFVFYAGVLLTVSLTSEEKILGWNEPKKFCGFYLDCHLHASVLDVRKTKTIGDKTAKGVFYVVRLKIFSDARRASLNLDKAFVYVIDGEGNRYPRAETAENPSPPFERKIPAGESFEKEVVFDLPPQAKDPRLDIAEGSGIERMIEAFLIGDEDSILHKRVRFVLVPENASAKF